LAIRPGLPLRVTGTCSQVPCVFATWLRLIASMKPSVTTTAASGRVLATCSSTHCIEVPQVVDVRNWPRSITAGTTWSLKAQKGRRIWRPRRLSSAMRMGISVFIEPLTSCDRIALTLGRLRASDALPAKG